MIERHRRPLIVVGHMLLVVASYLAAFLLRFDFALDGTYPLIIAETLPILVALRLGAFWRYHLFEGLWRYVGVGDAVAIFKAVTMSSLVFAGAVVIFFGHGFPRSVFVLDWMICGTAMGGARLAIRLFRERTGFQLPGDEEAAKRILIVGAGDAGEMLLREMQRNRKRYRVVAFVDDDRGKQRIRVHGVQVLGRVADIAEVAHHTVPDEIVIAVPSASPDARNRILRACRECQVPVKSVPGLTDLLTAKAGITQLRQVTPEHLVTRDALLIDRELERSRVVSMLRGNSVLITGAAGSIGSELCRQIADLQPGMLIMLERSESSLYYLELELKQSFPGVPCVPVIGDILDVELVDSIMDNYRPDAVFHAAAYKHVPLMEANPLAAVENNVFGTEIVARSAEQHGVATFVLISTDKAVRPVSVMGMTKRVAEGVLVSRGPGSGTRFIAVRFGNVLGSDGSVLPLFKWQIATGGPVTVTDPEASRYFMLTSEAVRLVLQAGVIGKGGDVYYLDMGEPMKVKDLAENLIRLSGMRPNHDVEVHTVGLRPGEKLHEELVTDSDELVPLENERMFQVREPGLDNRRFLDELEVLRALLQQRDASGCTEQLRRMTQVGVKQPSS